MSNFKRVFDVEVTADDIACGRRNSPGHCPVARAINRATGRPDVLVGGFGSLSVAPRENQLIGELPRAVMGWVSMFDSGGDAQPFRFQVAMDLPAPNKGGSP